MKGKSILMLAVALGCGLVAMIGVQQVLSGDKKEEVKQTTPVLVAVEEINSNEPIEDSMVTFKEMPSDMVPADAVTSPDQYVNRGLKTKAYPGAIIVQAMLGEEGAFNVSKDIPPGMRVAAIAVTAKTAVAGFVNPQDRVDIQVTYKRRVDGKTIERTKTVLEYVEVFAVDKQREMVDSETESIYKNISVLVTPEQVNLLRFAESKGELNFSLRNKDDSERVLTKDLDDNLLDAQQALMGEDDEAPQDGQGYANPALTQQQKDMRNAINQEVAAAPVEEEKKPEIWTMVIYHDGKKTVEEIPLPDPENTEPSAESTDPQNTEPLPSAS